jgi:NADPH-dependent curcumin reductase CurA
MSLIATRVNHQVRLAARPVGLPTAEQLAVHRGAGGRAGRGGVLVKTLALSLDPAMRGWMNEGKSYIPPVGIGEVMRAGGVGVVVASRHPAFAVGDTWPAAWACRSTGRCRPTSSSAAAWRRSTCAWARRRSGSTCWACPA